MANQTPPTPEELNVINQALEERILDANKDETKSKWNKLLPDLMAADVFVVAQLADKTDANGTKLLNILMMTDDKGHSIIPFFTSPKRMNVLVTQERKTFNVMKMNAVKLFQSIKGKTAVLNPSSPYAKLFTPFEMNILVMENYDKVAKQKHSEQPADSSEQ